jgi:DNA-binding transcriptional regulator YdaS (Cro superfamily)
MTLYPTLLDQYLRSRGELAADFARRAGVPAPSVSTWRYGRRRPGLASALRVERATLGAVPATYWEGMRPQRGGGER